MANFYDYSTENSVHALYMQRYLVSMCEGCIEKPCLNCHPEQALRRAPILYRNGNWNYRPILCGRENCEYGENCRFAHTIEEIEYHPLNYKTKTCENKSLTHQLQDTELCSYAHGDLRSKRYQTKAPRFNLDSFKVNQCTLHHPHSFQTCEMYHQKTDKRRDPSIYHYSEEPCTDPECKNDFCEFSHNSTEIDYHPLVYKTMLCKADICKLDYFCPFLHHRESDEIIKQVDDRQVRDLSEKVEMLEKIWKNMESKALDKKFLCSKCMAKPGDFIFQCGHFVCGTCSSSNFCEKCHQVYALLELKE